jgi:hypothetical protein
VAFVLESANPSTVPTYLQRAAKAKARATNQGGQGDVAAAGADTSLEHAEAAMGRKSNP